MALKKRQSTTEKVTSAFNSLSLTSHSPRPRRSTRVTSARRRRHEHRVEKQRRDKRLRMSQEIQRKLDEIETRLDELEREGVELEKTICSMDSSGSGEPMLATVATAYPNANTKEKLEQELYNLIHEKNLLTRVENELNIQ